MNEPFSEKSARQVIQQSGQFICPPQPDTLVSAQSVFPQNRFPNNQNPYQTNYQANYQMSRAGRSMHPQAQRTEERQPNPAADASGSLKPPLQGAPAAVETAKNAIKPESDAPGSLQTESIQCEETAPGNTVCQQNLPSPNSPRQQNGQDKMAEAATQPLQSCDVAYQAATPYPPVKISGLNSHYAAAMLDNMAGQNSEMSAVGLYFYANLVTAGYKDVAEAFLRINMVEMNHLNLFGELAMRLGENPRLWCRQPRSGRYMYWNPASLKYPYIQPPAPGCRISESNVRTILAQAIEGEQAAIRKYMQQTSWIQDVGICDILRRISADEQMHVDIFSRLYHQI